MTFCWWREKILLEGNMPERALLRLRRAEIPLFVIKKVAKNRILFSVKKKDCEKVFAIYPNMCYNNSANAAYKVKALGAEGVGKYLEKAKEKFIEKLKNVASIEVQMNVSNGTDFCTYIEQWMETAKKPHVKESTYKDYVQTVKTNIKPDFQDRTLESLTYSELQAFITKYQDDGKNRTAKKIYQLLSSLFDAAVADRLIPISPMLKVKLAHYETESGVPFTREEERQLLEDFKRDPSLYRQAFVFMLYTGVRRAELSSVIVENGWIHLVTAKQRKGFKEKIRSLPIPPMLQDVLPFINVDEIIKISPHLLTKHVHKQFENHHCHDLRHTFITRAQECKIPREYVSLWAGHKADNSITSNVYTHLEQNKELQVEEMQKFHYVLK